MASALEVDVKFSPDKHKLQKRKKQGHQMICESDFGAVGR